MRNHQTRITSEIFGDDSEQVKPIIEKNVSDSAALDAAFELYVRAGRSVPLVKTLLIPEAWSKRSELMPIEHRNMYEFSNAIVEPWDGPAAIAAVDGNWIIGGMDRNGLRPMRYSVSNDKIIYVGSETGMVRVDESKIVEKGRLGPGDIIGINLKEGKIYRNSDLKDYLAKEAPYEEYVKKIIRLDKRVTVSRESTVIETEKLRKRMIAAGFTMEELELILHPMVSDAKESTGSMGDDTPVAV